MLRMRRSVISAHCLSIVISAWYRWPLKILLNLATLAMACLSLAISAPVWSWQSSRITRRGSSESASSVAPAVSFFYTEQHIPYSGMYPLGRCAIRILELIVVIERHIAGPYFGRIGKRSFQTKVYFPSDDDEDSAALESTVLPCETVSETGFDLSWLFSIMTVTGGGQGPSTGKSNTTDLLKRDDKPPSGKFKYRNLRDSECTNTKMHLLRSARVPHTYPCLSICHSVTRKQS